MNLAQLLRDATKKLGNPNYRNYRLSDFKNNELKWNEIQLTINQFSNSVYSKYNIFPAEESARIINKALLHSKRGAYKAEISYRVLKEYASDIPSILEECGFIVSIKTIEPIANCNCDDCINFSVGIAKISWEDPLIKEREKFL